MLLVDDILLFPVHSLLWVFREIGKVAQEELSGEAQSVTEQLRLLYMQLETGRITEQQFAAEEKILLDRLEAIEDRLGDDQETDDQETDDEDTDDEKTDDQETGDAEDAEIPALAADEAEQGHS